MSSRPRGSRLRPCPAKRRSSNAVVRQRRSPLERQHQGNFPRVDLAASGPPSSTSAWPTSDPHYTYSHLAAIASLRPERRVGAGRHASRPSSRKSSRATPITAWCRLENSTDGRVADTLDDVHEAPGQESAARCSCGSITTCWPSAIAQRYPRGLQQAAGAVAVPQLAREASSRRAGSSR